jgi:hypothetical protein
VRFIDAATTKRSICAPRYAAADCTQVQRQKPDILRQKNPNLKVGRSRRPVQADTSPSVPRAAASSQAVVSFRVSAISPVSTAASVATTGSITRFSVSTPANSL